MNEISLQKAKVVALRDQVSENLKSHIGELERIGKNGSNGSETDNNLCRQLAIITIGDLFFQRAELLEAEGEK